MTEITTAAKARKDREAALDQVFASAVSKVEKELRAFVASGDADDFYVTVAPRVRDRVAAAYRDAGWLVILGSDDDRLRIEFPASVEGIHPDQRQSLGAPVLDFWRFVYERQAIWHRRVELEQDRPWTEDPVLRERFFTNIFRDLDPGTEVAAAIVSHKGRPTWERLWNLLVYRRFNREETWERALGYKRFDGPIILSALRDDLRGWYDNLADFRAETGLPIFTDAHQVYPMPMIPGPDLASRFFRVMLDVSQANREPDSVYSLAEKLGAAKTRKDAYRAFVNAKIPGISSFLSWQLTMDCTYGPDPIVRADDDWAPITTGARFGAIMWYHWPTIGTVNYPIDGWPSLKSVPPKELEQFVQGMRDEQEARFDERGLDFGAVSAGRKLDMPALEHALCEYSKYVAAAVGLPTRDRWSQTPARGEKRASDKAVQALAAKRDEALKAIDLAGPFREVIGRKSQSKVDSDATGEGGVNESSPARRSADVTSSVDPDPDQTNAERTSPPAAASSSGGAEERFREAIRAIDGRGEEPTPKAIFAELGGSSVSLNSRQAAWRRDELDALGYVKVNGKYTKEES